MINSQRKCWWDGITIDLENSMPKNVKLWARRVWTLELSLVRTVLRFFSFSSSFELTKRHDAHRFDRWSSHFPFHFMDCDAESLNCPSRLLMSTPDASRILSSLRSSFLWDAFYILPFSPRSVRHLSHDRSIETSSFHVAKQCLSNVFPVLFFI